MTSPKFPMPNERGFNILMGVALVAGIVSSLLVTTALVLGVIWLFNHV